MQKKLMYKYSILNLIMLYLYSFLLITDYEMKYFSMLPFCLLMTMLCTRWPKHPRFGRQLLARSNSHHARRQVESEAWAVEPEVA
jgi:hypothetical protein